MSASVKSIHEIKSLFLADFQSHAKTSVELAPGGGVTIIVGQTDSGKTAIVRALRLLFYNIPQGLDYIRVGRSMAAVAVEMSDGTKVARERSKSVNRYRVTKPGESASVFEGFGGAVPLEVQEATGVRTVTVGDLELALNLSEQLDGPFLGNKAISGPGRAKILGKLAGTEEVDEAQRELGTDVFRAGQEEKRLLNEIEALNARIRDYDYLPALAEKISALEKLLGVLSEMKSLMGVLERTRERLANIQDQRIKCLDVLVRWKGLARAASLIAVAEAENDKSQALAKHKSALANLAGDRAAWERVVARWTNLPQARGLILEADAAQSMAVSLINLRDSLAATKAGQERARATINRWVHLDEAASLAGASGDAVSRLDALSVLRSRLVDIGARIADVRAACDRWAGLDGASRAATEAAATQERLTALSACSESLTRIRHAKVVAENDLDSFSKMLRDAQRQYSDTLVSMGRCPTCGSKVNASLIKEVA